MKSKFIPRTVFSGITITTILIIALVFMMFFFVSVQNKEHQIIDRGFRILNQYANNLDSRYSNFLAMAINENEKSTNKNYISIDSIMGNHDLKFNDEKWLEENIEPCITMVVSAKQWVKNLFSDEIFSDYLLINNNTVLYKSFDHNFTVNNFDSFVEKALKENNSNKSLLKKSSDTSLNAGNYFESGFISDISLSHTKYKLFIFPVLLETNKTNTLYLGALIKTNDFNKAKRSTDSWLVIFIILLFTAVIISLPIIKLFLLNTIERMKASQMYYAGAAIIFGFAIINVIFLNRLTASYLITQSEKQVQYLNTAIQKELITEITEAYNTLNALDTNQKLTDTTSCFLAKPEFIDIYNSESIYPFFRTAFWMDKEGQQLIELSTWNDATNMINLKHRNYFTKYDEWVLPNNSDQNKKFRLESIYSNTKGIALMALSMPSDKKNFKNKTTKAKVAALTSPMYSIIETILPKGYGFRIIDKNGLVWFHNNKDKNLQENLFEETNHNRKLKASIQSRVKNHFTLSIYGKKYYAYISPISNIPLYLVTLEDKNANTHQNSQITVALLLFLSSVLLSGILFVIFLTIVNLNKSTLHHRIFVLSWLFPSKKGNDKIEYSFLLFINSLQIIGLFIVVFFIQTGSMFSAKSSLLICFGLFLFNTILPYYILRVVQPEDYSQIKYKSKTQAFIHKYRQCKRFLRNKNNSPLLIALAIIGALYLVLGISYEIAYALIGLVLIVAVFVSAIAFKYLANKNNRHELFDRLHRTSNTNYIAYKKYMLSWLLILSFLIPTFFYKMLFVETSQIKLKHQQVYLAKQYEKRCKSIDQHYGNNIYRKNEPNDSLIIAVKELKKNKGIYSHLYYESEIGNIKKNNTGKSPNWFNLFFHRIDGLLGQQGMFPPDFNKPQAADNIWNWQITKPKNKFFYKNLIFNYQYSSKYLNTNSFNSLCIESKLPTLSPVIFKTNKTNLTSNKKEHYSYLFVYLFAVCTTLLFAGFLIKKLLSRLFPYHYQNTKANYSLNEAIKKYFTNNDGEIIKPAFDLVFVNSLGLDQIKNEIKDNYTFEDFSKYGGFTKENVHKKIIFTSLVNTPSDLKERIEQIEKHRQKNETPLVILSQLTPNQLIKKYSEYSSDEHANEYLDIAEQLKVFFASTITCFIDENIVIPDSEPKNIYYHNELKHSQFLVDLHYKLFNNSYNAENIPLTDEQILQIQHIATNYYRNLWNSCTAEEQFILFDLATDSVTNTNNREELDTLIHKRLIKTENGLEIMNQSFANFIIEYTKTDKLKYMEFEAKRKSGWGKFRIPLILVGLAIFVFIIITQQGLISNLYAILISVGGIISVATKYGSLFKGLGRSAS